MADKVGVPAACQAQAGLDQGRATNSSHNSSVVVFGIPLTKMRKMRIGELEQREPPFWRQPARL